MLDKEQHPWGFLSIAVLKLNFPSLLDNFVILEDNLPPLVDYPSSRNSYPMLCYKTSMLFLILAFSFEVLFELLIIII